MFSTASRALRGLMVVLFVLGIGLGVLLAQVVPPAAAGVSTGARDLLDQLAEERRPAQPAPAPSQAVQPAISRVAWADIVEQVGPAVVTVVTEMEPSTPTGGSFGFGTPWMLPQPQPRPQGMGSGVIVDDEGYVVTNNHVIQNGRSYQVILADGTKVPARLVGRDDFSDLAVLQIDGPLPAVATLGDSEALRPGEPVIAIGSPLGDFRNTVTQGVVSAVGRRLADSAPGLTGLVQTDAPINQGNSGGPLVDAQGRVVGINVAVVRGVGPMGMVGGPPAEGLGFAIPSNTVKEVVDGLIVHGKVARPYLGVNFQTVNPRIAAYYDLAVKEGVLILAVAPNSPAGKAGLQAGDVIVQVDGKSVGEKQSLAQLLAEHAVNEEVKLTISRNGQEQTVSVKLGERPAPTS